LFAVKQIPFQTRPERRLALGDPRLGGMEPGGSLRSCGEGGWSRIPLRAELSQNSGGETGRNVSINIGEKSDSSNFELEIWENVKSEEKSGKY